MGVVANKKDEKSREKVKTWADIKENLYTLTDDNDYYTKVLQRGECIVAYKQVERFLFGPSRFVGYRKNNLCHESLKKHGGSTNDAIRKILGDEKIFTEFPGLDEKFIEFVTRRGVEPHNRKRKYWLIEGVESNYYIELDRQVSESRKLDSKQRHDRLLKADSKPQKIKIETQVYRRNPDVIAEVLIEAKGVCSLCGNEAPFIRSSDNTPYLEVHHIKRLSDGGEDTIANTIAVCPNCHRMLHYGSKNDINNVLKGI